MAFDTHSLLAISTVANSPSTGGSIVSFNPGDTEIFGQPPFNAIVWPPAVNPTLANTEIIRILAFDGDDSTVDRAQEGTTVKDIQPGWNIANSITPKIFTDIETAIQAAGGVLKLTDSNGVLWTLSIATDGALITSSSSSDSALPFGLALALVM